MLTLEIARQLRTLYQQMSGAAETADWDLLGALERESVALCRATEQQQHPIPRTAEEVAELQGLINEILELDRAIRVHAEPAMESTRKLLASAVKGRAMRNAYGG